MIKVEGCNVYISEDEEELAIDLAHLLLLMRQERPHALFVGISTYKMAVDKELDFKYGKVVE